MTREEKKNELIALFVNGAMPIGELIDECFEFGQQQPNWISVEDELPSETGLYLVVQYDVVQAYWWFDGIEEWHETFMWNDEIHSRRMEGVTHWMSLPPAPSGSSELPNNPTKAKEKGGEQ